MFSGDKLTKLGREEDAEDIKTKKGKGNEEEKYKNCVGPKEKLSLLATSSYGEHK